MNLGYSHMCGLSGICKNCYFFIGNFQQEWSYQRQWGLCVESGKRTIDPQSKTVANHCGWIDFDTSQQSGRDCVNRTIFDPVSKSKNICTVSSKLPSSNSTGDKKEIVIKKVTTFISLFHQHLRPRSWFWNDVLSRHRITTWQHLPKSTGILEQSHCLLTKLVIQKDQLNWNFKNNLVVSRVENFDV